MTKLSFCHSDPPLSESFWQKNRLVTHILFDLCLRKHFSPVANFGQQSLCKMKKKGEIIYLPFFSDRLCRRCYSSHDLKFLTGFELGTEAAISRSPASTASTASGQGNQTLCSQTTSDPSCTCGLFL